MTLFAVLIGSLLGFLGGPPLVIIPWGVAGLLLGYGSTLTKKAILRGFLYGFFLIFFFMVGGYRGAAPLLTRIVPFALLGVVGGICGIASSFVGVLAKRVLPATPSPVKPWFNQKKYGYGWGLPATWQGWGVLVLYIIFVIYDFFRIDHHSHSASDTLINFVPQLLLVSVLLVFIVRITSGKPKWRWGNKKNKFI